MKKEDSKLVKSPIQIKITQDSQDQHQTQTAKMTTNYNQATKQLSSTTEFNEQTQDSSSETVCQAKEGDAKNTSSGIDARVTFTDGGNQEQTHAYGRRFFILALFCAHSAINSFQWIEYSSITDIISSYYGATNIQVNLTSLVYMITYIPFIIQASLMLERVGLKKAIILGTLGTALGSLIKWQMGGQPEMGAFWWMMLGQTVVALSQLYIISIPPLLAAVWFPDHQVSTATGIGVFGNQLGIALGFIIPPMVINDLTSSKDIIGQDLNSLSCYVFWISFVICIVSILALEDKPPKPPGSASFHASQQQDTDPSERTYASIKELCKDKDFIFLKLSYGINVGVFYAVSTVLNQLVEKRGEINLAGKLGLLIVVSGMVGSVACGQLLDRTHAYKLIIVLIYFFSLVSMLIFTIVLQVFTTSVWPLYLVSIVVGFFTTGYLPLGFEFAAETTYPHPANTPAGLLNLSAQVFGLILTYTFSTMVDEIGDLWANIFLTLCLAIGLVLTVAMKADLKRQKAVAEEQLRI